MSRQIYITENDFDKLNGLLNEALIEGVQGDDSFKILESELKHAKIVDAKMLPRNVVTMNSIILIDLNGYDEEVSLVYPHDTDLIENKISVLSPIGTAILGYSEGDTINCDVPSGAMNIKIKNILYQPEAAGDYDS